MLTSPKNHLMHLSARPWTRWWWFSGEISKTDIDYQLEWADKSGFGGVEIAWVYPLPSSRPDAAFLSDKWTDLVVFAKNKCDELGIGCDFTFGTMWPFGGSFVDESYASRVSNGLSEQRLHATWETPFTGEPSKIIDHLSKSALRKYSKIVGSAIKPALDGGKSGLFCDSWEIDPNGLWTDGFETTFREKFGYDISDYIPEIEKHPDVFYDYRRLVSELILNEFYREYRDICRNLGGLSRVQCHGAPTDLIAAYGAVDIPESESLLYEPNFSRIASSAAILTGKNIASCETFTCIYGWKPRPGPAPYNGKEIITDLKLLADAVFAEGVNQIVWHGMPFNGPDDKNEFYASVHVGQYGELSRHFKSFNKYLENVSEFMRRGRTYTDVAVYLPVEDSWMNGRYPDSEHFVDPQYHYEHRYLKLPSELMGYHPMWVSGELLKHAKFEDSRIRFVNASEAEFRMLWVDVEWLDEDNLEIILALAEAGSPVYIKSIPEQPGKVKTKSYDEKIRDLYRLKNVSDKISPEMTGLPLVEFEHKGSESPGFFARIDTNSLIVFFADPYCRAISYPMTYGMSLDAPAFSNYARINVFGQTFGVPLSFYPNQSLLFEFNMDGEIVKHDIELIVSC